MNPLPAVERRVVIALALVALAGLVLVAWLNPGLVRFWPFTPGEFVQLITPLFMVALFIERVVEVFLTTWRTRESAMLGMRANAAGKKATEGGEPPKAHQQLADYRARTQRIAFLTGTVVGVVIAALGVRVLELFVDPAVFEALPGPQQRLFRTGDVLLSGAVIGGSADALHKLVSVFTNFMDSSARWAKERGANEVKGT